MSNKQRKNTESPTLGLKSEAARQRWELFHRAIAHAKESNQSSMADGAVAGDDADDIGPFLTIVK